MSNEGKTLESLLNEAVHSVDRGDLSSAKAGFKDILKRAPNHSAALAYLGDIERRMGNLVTAETLIRKAVNAGSPHPIAFSALHAVLMDSGRMPEALAAINQAVEANPNEPILFFTRAQTLESMGHLSNARAAVKQCRVLQPEWPAATGLEASILRKMGYGEKATDILRGLLDTSSPDPIIRGKIILAMQGDPRVDLKSLLNEAKQAWIESPPVASDSIAPPVKQNKKLKIAYVSGDFREHPVGYFMEGVLAAHDRSLFDVHLVPTVAGTDARTDKMKHLSDGWHPIMGLTDGQAVALIRSLEIDIAIDLSGWTRGHRLGVFRHRAAPVQITWMGYSGTTGLDAMDYILCDETVLPRDQDAFYSETPLRLPGTYLSIVPPNKLLPDLGARPAPKKNRIICGSFNTLAKLSEDVLDAWAEILLRVEGSILLLRAQQLGDMGVKADLVSRFSKRRIKSDRLILEGNNTRKGMLASYRKVDIALDPFPYGGTTTTFEALCMGVPVITRRGDRWVGLVGTSILQSLRRQDLIAEDRTDYVEKAVALAQDVDRLTALRFGLSEEVLKSRLCDTVAFTRDLETALHQCWLSQCEKQTLSSH